ncbi:nuclear transport factor 2 family protein [Parashewanella curva]|uniref:Nuclear transport factor 2 family protein n=1 Tax=Parashewanella curva TaxID=2338552 RepID=A0A3L8Q1Z9_9GAMM|nr:nuclear transport factor 2 family protein [Parashewanella curva]RLV61614.1 nuclear transport factor 2 family protein [Parashewanella curva]
MSAQLENSSNPIWLNNIVELYQTLTKQELNKILDVYHEDVVFRDPIHRVVGVDELHEYFQTMYKNTTSCEFDIYETFFDKRNAALYWKMTFINPKINRGNPILVEGHSLIRGQGDKVIYHRDYYDVGEMVYEHVPLLGFMVRKLKRFIGKCKKS